MFGRLLTPWLACGLALFVCLGWLYLIGRADYPLDDAYIVQHVVDSLHQRRDVRFEAGALTGVTSPVHVALVWMLSFVLPIDLAQFGVAMAGYCLFLSGMAVLAGRHCQSPIDRLVFFLLVAGLGMALYQALNGLETGLVMALLVWVMVFFARPLPTHVASNLLLGVGPLLRPELLVLSGLLLLRQLFALMRGPDHQVRAARMALTFGYLALGFAGPAVFVWHFGGAIWPQTALAKKYFFAEGCMPVSVKSQVVWAALLTWSRELGVLSVGWVFLIFVPLGRWLLAFLGLFLGAYLLNFPGALFHNSQRYLCALLPLVLMGWVWAAGRVQGKRWGLALRVSLLIAVAQSWLSFPVWVASLSDGVRFSRTELREVATWVAQNTPSNSRVLVHDAGYISLLGQQRLIDLVGLKTPDVVPIHGALTWAQCSRNTRALSVIADQFDAQYFVVFNDWDRIFKLTAGLRGAGWGLRRIDGVRGARAYVVYSLERPHEVGR